MSIPGSKCACSSSGNGEVLAVRHAKGWASWPRAAAAWSLSTSDLVIAVDSMSLSGLPAGLGVVQSDILDAG